MRTDRGAGQAPLTPEQGADTPVWLATLPDGGPTGGFFRERQLQHNVAGFRAELDPFSVSVARTVDKFPFRFISDPTAAFAAVMAEDVDAFVGYPAPENLPQFANTHPPTVMQSPPSSTASAAWSRSKRWWRRTQTSPM